MCLSPLRKIIVGPLNECWLGVKQVSLYFTGTGVNSSGANHLCLSMDLFSDLARNCAIKLVSVTSCYEHTQVFFQFTGTRNCDG